MTIRSARNHFAVPLFIVSLSLMLMAATVPAAPSAAVAVVTDESGKVETLESGRPPRSTAILEELAVGSRLQLAAGSRVVVLWLDSGVEFELTGPARAEIRALEIHSESGAPPKKRTVFTAAGGKDDIRIRPQGTVQASVLMREGKPEVTLLSPVGAKILDSRPTFEWKLIPDLQSSRIQITNDSLKTVFELATTGGSLRLPEGISLKPGAAYTWEIEARDSSGHRVSGWAEFSVASEEERVRVERIRPKPEARFGERVAFALMLESLELFGEARETWKTLALERPDDPAIQARLAGKK